ncbi:MAG: GMC family oxidoreductase N-terminal domain-containing protein [Actinomycetota bacterium]
MDRPGTVPPSAQRVLSSLARGALGDRYSSEVPGRILSSLAHLPSDGDRKRLLGILRALDTRAGALMFTGRPVPVSWLRQVEAEAVLQRWKHSRVASQRALFLTLVSKSLGAVYGYEGPEWDRIGYQGPMGPPPDTRKRLQPLEMTRDEVVSCDIVIVGSGAGGGCTAAVLAQAGYEVVVIEKGGYYNEADFTHHEAEATRDMYLYGMNLATVDLGVQIIAGSTLGGGTVVNYTTSFKTPPHVLKEWAQVSGIDAFVSGEIEASLDAASTRLSVNTDSSAAGRRDELLEEGLKKLGWHVDALPRAVNGCTQDERCGFCGFGCRPGAKQSSMRTWLEDATEHGARIITGADVRRVRISNGRATGIEALAGRHRLVVNARAVVVSAGSIESPALLLRSGLRGRVGHYLRLHPGTAAWGVFDDDVRMWEGTLQARYSNEIRHWDGGYGPIFETVPVHPGSGSSVIPWVSAADHARAMRDYGKTGFCAVLPRDASAGRVKIARDGGPRVHYRLSSDDERRIVEGTIAAGKVMEAAGAKSVRTTHHVPIEYVPGPGAAHDRWADEVRSRGFPRGRVTFFSYHQMGSCRMGVDPSTSAIGPENETHEVRDLYVVDGSAFPTASGVNPMLSIYGIAHRAANKIAARYA